VPEVVGIEKREEPAPRFAGPSVAGSCWALVILSYQRNFFAVLAQCCGQIVCRAIIYNDDF
jgi:hypothetical protein